ncbi:S41 family peptidase [Dellaglioa algida]|uniref:S41 family peptidase n=1 Tax=Dellaglioa algida TaxID=105612 RepID=UPI000BC5FCF0|nr:S41 family peptidase [Dellaglioa algida]MDK1718048.1 S41 family peptidase [Dellaglioa algida]MDK1726349.1 S41 family peptidase [Dellaglioa algida]MDK1729183.1 S41 family peptidase [Dellaglioa algida]MDK1741617.1 S41 family peptidase [Dellaglioa algida]SOB49628.1 Carboxy-terminal processing protease CtpA [Dellaglioa algida]
MKEEKDVKRFKFDRHFWTLVGSICLSFIIGAAAMYFFAIRQINTAVGSLQATSADLSKIESVYTTLNNSYYKDISKTKLVNGAINGMVDATGDKFTAYLGKADATNLDSSISSKFVGIGAEVKINKKNIQIVSAIKGTPAKKAGLKTDDIIQKIDGKSVYGESLEKAVSKIRGKKGTTVKLTIQRGSSTFNVSIKRDDIPVKTVYSNLSKENKKIGYIQISTFAEKTSDEVKSAVKSLRKEGATSFVLDVRDNPGGLMDQALAISSMFLKDGKKIMQVQPKTGSPEIYKAGKEYDSGFKVTEKTVVIINKDSASASEILAAALNQSANDKLIGATSYGKGTVQTVNNFTDKTELKVTIAKWLTPDGSWIHGKGIKPTITADYPAYAYSSLIDTDKTYKKEDVSTQVKNIQIYLQALGYYTDKNNGYFGTSTVTAVKSFQESNKLDQSGEVNKETALKLESLVQQKISKNDPAYDAAIKAVIN